MAKREKVQLLSFWASPFVMRAQMALALKDVEYEILPQDLKNKGELLLQSNPVHKKVPVLLHNGRPICESLIIAQYVDETWQSPNRPNILPEDTYGRAMARFWADFVDKKLLEPLYEVLKASKKGLAEERKAAEANTMGALSTLEETLASGGPFFGGKQMGLVDVMLAPLLVAWTPVIQQMAPLHIPWEKKLPRLHAAVAAMRAHPATSGFPEPAKLVEFCEQAFAAANE